MTGRVQNLVHGPPLLFGAAKVVEKRRNSLISRKLIRMCGLRPLNFFVVSRTNNNKPFAALRSPEIGSVKHY